MSSQLDNEDNTTNQNKNNTSNIDDIHSCVTSQKNSVHAPYTSLHLTPLNTTLPFAPVELHKTIQSPLSVKEYLCFQVNSKSTHTAHCVKS